MPRSFWSFALLGFVFSATTASGVVLYANANNPAPFSPYTNWATAASTIQDAVDAARAGDEILVTNGIFQTGGRVVYGQLTNRLAVTKAVTVRSVNGPEFTVIEGFQVPGLTNGDGAVRCVYLTNGAFLVGFTLTAGATRSADDLVYDQSGGGLWAESVLAGVTNCILSNNVAQRGGGAYSGTLSGCTFLGNLARREGGGAYNADLRHCLLTNNSASTGGGAYGGLLDYCVLSGNSADDGGGVYHGNVLSHCILTRNVAGNSSGGVFGGSLNNCLLVGNSANGVGGGECFASLDYCTLALNAAGTIGGGAYFGTLNNCIVYDNEAEANQNHYGANLSYSCTTPLPSGQGNFTNAPRFVDPARDDLRLQPASPCINSGGNSEMPDDFDLDGLPRIAGGTVDVGAYEFQAPASLLSYAWLMRYGLPVDGSVDRLDLDGDHASNWQEWRAGTSPLDGGSVLRLLKAAPGVGGVALTWRSVVGRTYFVDRSTNAGTFLPWMRDLSSRGVMTTIFVPDVVGPGSALYRVGVQE